MPPVRMQVQPVVVASPNGSDHSGLFKYRHLETELGHRSSTGEACWSGAYNDRVRINHRVLVRSQACVRQQRIQRTFPTKNKNQNEDRVALE